MVAKAGLGLIGLSAISVGGVALTKPHLLGMDYMPEWHSLSEDNNFSTSYTGDTAFGKKYGKYLVGVTNKTGAGEEAKKDNKAWWEWAYRRFQANKPTTDSKFKSVGRPYGTDATALNKVCEDAYKKSDSDFQTTASNASFTKEEVWKYCSPGKLTTTSEDKGENAYKTTEIGGEENNKTKLISVKNSDNDWFWKIRDEEFWGTEGELSGSKTTNNSSFKTEYGNKDKPTRKTIKQLCGEAYEFIKNDKSDDNTDANKFCKLETN